MRVAEGIIHRNELDARLPAARIVRAPPGAGPGSILDRPGDEPAHFIGESMDRFELITKGSGVVIRPWLQAFHWRTKTYSPEYIKVQVETARAKGGIGFLFWNAANDYSKPFAAMPEMKASNFKPGSKDSPKYFRGDELPAASVQAALIPQK